MGFLTKASLVMRNMWKSLTEMFTMSVNRRTRRRQKSVKMNGVEWLEQRMVLDAGERLLTVFAPVQQEVALVETGNLFIEESPVPVVPQHLLGGVTGGSLIDLLMTSEGEDIEVFGICITTTHTESIERIPLYFPGTPAPFAIATKGAVGSQQTPAGYDAYFASIPSGALIVPAGGVHVLPYALIRTDGDGGTNEDVQASLLSSFISVFARGTESHNELVPNNADGNRTGEWFVGVANASMPNNDLVGPAHDIVMAEPKSIINGSSDPDDSLLQAGTSLIGVYDASAARHNNTNNGVDRLLLETMTFTLHLSNVSIDLFSLKLVNLEDPNVMVAPTSVTMINVYTYTFTFDHLTSSQLDTTIRSGDTVKFGVRATIEDPTWQDGFASHLFLGMELGERFAWYTEDVYRGPLQYGMDGQYASVYSTTYVNS